ITDGRIIPVGKGGKTRHCPLWPATMTSLRALTQGRSPDEPVFRNRRRLPVTRFFVHATVTRYVTEAAIACPSLAKKSISPHVIRHTTAELKHRLYIRLNFLEMPPKKAKIQYRRRYRAPVIGVRERSLMNSAA